MGLCTLYHVLQRSSMWDINDRCLCVSAGMGLGSSGRRVMPRKSGWWEGESKVHH